MSEFSHLSQANGLVNSAQVAGVGGSSGDGERVSLTPQHMRALMKQWIDPLDVLFDKHRWMLYQTMELNAQQNLFEAEYTVQDDETADEAKLSLLFQRLMKWAQRKGFAVRTSGRALRSFIVSWDPLATPESITMEEKQDPRSVAVRRMRAYQNNQQDLLRSASPRKTGAGSAGTIVKNAIGFVQDPVRHLVETLEQQREVHDARIDEFAEYLAAPPEKPTTQQQRQAHHHPSHQNHQRYLSAALIGNNHDEDNNAVRRARAIASRAAVVAGGQGEENDAPVSQSE